MTDPSYTYDHLDRTDALLDEREPPKYAIVQKRLAANHWQVWWDGEMVYEHKGEGAEFCSGALADGLERGITGSKRALFANSKIRLEGFMDYLEAFDSYEHWRDAG